MPYVYRPRGMPARFMDGAPDVIRRNVLDIVATPRDSVLEYDVVFRPEPDAAEIVGLDFGVYGWQGCHFFLEPHKARAYRERNRRKRVAWADLPEPTRKSILRYLAEEA
jgi:hypothetical protein